jgi:hypothetical protein
MYFHASDPFSEATVHADRVPGRDLGVPLPSADFQGFLPGCDGISKTFFDEQ